MVKFDYQFLNKSTRGPPRRVQRKDLQSATSVDTSENMNARDRLKQRQRTVEMLLERTLETYQASARKLLINLIKRGTERNNAKFTLMTDYQRVLSSFDSAFAQIRNEERADTVEEIISTIERSETINKTAELQKTQIENEIEQLEAEVEKDRIFIMEALNESSKFIDTHKMKELQSKLQTTHASAVRTM